MGGTFMSLPLDYRDYFVRNLHDALSGHSSSNVQEAVQFSEQSRTRCIGLTIETRPDYCLTPHLTQVPFPPATKLQQAYACCRKQHARRSVMHEALGGVCHCMCCEPAYFLGWYVLLMPDYTLHAHMDHKRVACVPADAIIWLHKTRDWPAKYL